MQARARVRVRVRARVRVRVRVPDPRRCRHVPTTLFKGGRTVTGAYY